MALLQDLRTGIGFKRQVNLKTPVTAAEVWSLLQTNRNVAQATLVTENDAEWIGKGIWPTAVYPTNWDVNIPFEARLTSENFAQCVTFALAKVTEAAGTPAPAVVYTVKPYDPATATAGDCMLDMPTTTFIQEIKECASDVVNHALVGVACEEFTVALTSGPGLDNATITSTWAGTGKFIDPSGIAIPPYVPEHSLRAGGAALTIVGTDYVANHKFVSLNVGYKNNLKLDQGFFPGSGVQNNASIRGRMRRGTPTFTLNYVAEYTADSDELAKFFALTEGAATIAVSGATIGVGPAKHGFSITFPRVMFSSTVLGENDNTLTVAVECMVLQNTATGEIMNVTATTEKAGIFTLSAATPLLAEEEEVKKAA